MIEERRTNQGGSVATFVVVGIILVVALISAVYLVNLRGQQARDSQEIATSETKKPVSTGSSKSNTSTSVENDTTEETTSQNLPATGPDINLTQLLGVYLLTVTFTAYFLSRRKLARSL